MYTVQSGMVILLINNIKAIINKAIVDQKLTTPNTTGKLTFVLNINCSNFFHLPLTVN